MPFDSLPITDLTAARSASPLGAQQEFTVVFAFPGPNRLSLIALLLSGYSSLGVYGQGVVTGTKAPCTGGVLNSRVIAEARLHYPSEARRMQLEGSVAIRVKVNESGEVYEATRCRGPELLQRAAIAAAYKTRLSPTVLQGVPVKVSGLLLYLFKLKEKRAQLADGDRAQQQAVGPGRK
jgi:TonB family protein